MRGESGDREDVNDVFSVISHFPNSTVTCTLEAAARFFEVCDRECEIQIACNIITGIDAVARQHDEYHLSV